MVYISIRTSLTNFFSLFWLHQILPRQIDHTVKDSLNEDEVPDHVLNSIHWRLILVPALTGLFSLILLGLTWHFYLEFGQFRTPSQILASLPLQILSRG